MFRGPNLRNSDRVVAIHSLRSIHLEISLSLHITAFRLLELFTTFEARFSTQSSSTFEVVVMELLEFIATSVNTCSHCSETFSCGLF